MRKIIILIKFFVTTSEGKFRKSMILPLLCILISSFVISFTNSITNGMETEVENLIQAFTYPCKISTSSNVANNTSVNFGGNYTILLNEIKNRGFRVKTLSNFSDFINSVPDKYYYAKNEVIDGAFISKRLMDNYKINMNDKIQIYNISEIKFSKSISLNVAGVFNDNLIEDYDIIIPHRYSDDIFNNNRYLAYFFDNTNDAKNFLKLNNLDVEIRTSEGNSMLKWLKIEMLIYKIISYISIFIASFIIYMNSILLYLEKRKQLSFLHILGLTRKKIVLYCSVNIVFLAFIFSLIGQLATYLLIDINDSMNFMINIIPEPFDPVPMYLPIVDMMFIQFVILVVITIAFILPFIKFSKRDLFNQIN